MLVLRAAHARHSLYGCRRLGLHLGWNRKKAARIRSLAGVQIARPSKKKRYGSSARAEIPAASNALKRFANYRDQARPQAGQTHAGMVDSGAGCRTLPTYGSRGSGTTYQSSWISKQGRSWDGVSGCGTVAS